MPIHAFTDFSKKRFDLRKEPFLLVTGLLMNEDDWKGEPHVHSQFCELLYVAEGNGVVKIGHDRYEVKNGDLLIYNTDTPHYENFSNSIVTPKLYFCQIGNLSIQGLQEGNLIPPYISPVIPCRNTAVESYFKAMVEECSNQRLGYEIIAGNMLMSLLITILRHLNDEHKLFSQKDRSTLVSEIKQHIEANYKENISLKEMAARFHVSTFYLSHIFRSNVGDSPINYLISRRIEEAKKLLLTTDFSIQTISRMIGYENVSHFSLIFKKSTSVPPRDFRDLYANGMHVLEQDY